MVKYESKSIHSNNRNVRDSVSFEKRPIERKEATMSDQEAVPSLPSTEDTKLGTILKDLTPELQDVKDSITYISNRYRSDLTSQLDQSLRFEQHLSKNFARLSRKSKRLYQNSENLNTSLNKKLDQLKPFDELESLTQNISDSVFGILDSLNQIEMILPYNERLGVRDSPHRAHYPNLYNLLNHEEDESTIREDEIEGFEQLNVQQLRDFDGDVEDGDELEEINSDEGEEDDHGGAVNEEIQTQENDEQVHESYDNEDDDNDQELTFLHKSDQEVVEEEHDGDDDKNTENEQELQSIENFGQDETELDDITNVSIHETEFKDDNTPETMEHEMDVKTENIVRKDTTTNNQDTNTNADKSINIPNLEHEPEPEQEPQTDEAKQQELESVIDNYKSVRSQSIRSSFRPISSAISIPSTSSGITNISISTSSGSDQAQGQLVSGSLNGSGLTENLKKFMKS